MRRLLKCDPKRLAGVTRRASGALALIVLFAFPVESETLNNVPPEQSKAERTQVTGDRRDEIDQLLQAG
jgi:hypothetical protein